MTELTDEQIDQAERIAIQVEHLEEDEANQEFARRVAEMVEKEKV